MGQQRSINEEGPDSGLVLEPIRSTRRGSIRSAASTASPARSANLRVRRPTITDRRQPSIRLRRLGSTSNLRSDTTTVTDFAHVNSNSNNNNNNQETPSAHEGGGNRRRSSSEPQRMQYGSHLAPPETPSHSGGRSRGLSSPMPPLDEGVVARGTVPTVYELDGDVPHEAARRPGLFSRASTAARSGLGINAMNTYNERRKAQAIEDEQTHDNYEDGLVDYLDVVDPEVATLSTLTNVQNSLFIPNLGSLLNRRPTYTFTREPSYMNESPTDTSAEQTETEEDGERPMMNRSVTITSQLNDAEDHYAVLPHGIRLKGWTNAERQELNDHVRHMLHSRRAAFKRSMKGFGQYVRRPLGFFVTLYAFLITAFGLLWVLFLIGWISVGGRQSYVINIIDNVLVALFAIMGDGLIPFRIMDTYHMIYIAHYHHLTWKLRKKRNMPELKDHNDLPGLQPKVTDDIEPQSPKIAEESEAQSPDLEAGYAHGEDDFYDEEPVLNEEQQRKLKHHQDKFAKSHTFYKPHETTTHHAFPLRLLVAVVVLLDFHSIFQVALGTCTWAISYHVRPQALTTVILCCSITCNITGGVLISIGDKRTRKKEVVEKMFRQKLTEQAIHKMERRRKREQQRNQALNEPVVPDLAPVLPETITVT